RLAGSAGYRHGAPDGHLGPARRHAGRPPLCGGAFAGSLGYLAAASALAALGVRTGLRRCARLRLAGRLRSACPAGLPDGSDRPVMAPALSPPWRLAAAADRAGRGASGRSAGQSAARFLVVVRRGGVADLDLPRAARRSLMVEGVVVRAMGHGAGVVAGDAGAGPAGQPERAVGESAGRSLDQRAGRSAGLAGQFPVVGSLAWRGLAMARRRLAGGSVRTSGADRRLATGLAGGGAATVGVGPRGTGYPDPAAARRCAAADAGCAAAGTAA